MALVQPHTQAQSVCDFDWARRSGGPAADAALAAATDPRGNVYVTGRFAQAASFGSFTFTARGETDAFVAKYRPDGSVEWALQLGGFGRDEGRAITVDASGSTYVTGTFSGRSTYGTFTLFSLGQEDIFIIKIDTRGRVQWAKRAGGPFNDRSNGIAVDRRGFILLTGSFVESCGFTGTEIVLQANGQRDAFSARYNNAGDIQWARSSGSVDGDDEGWGIAADSLGNAYVVGEFTGVADFGGRTLTAAGGRDAFMIRRRVSDGEVEWLTQAGGPENDAAYDVIMGRGDSLVVTGVYAGTATFPGNRNLSSAGGLDIFALRLAPNGTPDWLQSYGGTSDDVVASIATDGRGFYYLGGSFQGPAAFGATILPHSGGTDLFVAKIDPQGNPFWALSAGAAQSDSCAGVAVNSDGVGYAVGLFTNAVNFGATNPLSTLTAEPDAFVARLCNFSPRPCTFDTIKVKIKNPGIVGDDGEIEVIDVVGGRPNFRYSLDNITYGFENIFFDLTPGDYTVFVQDLTGCTDSIAVTLILDCERSINSRFVGLDTVYCKTDINAYALNVDADEAIELLGYEGTTGLQGNTFVPALAPIGPNEILAILLRLDSGCEDTARIVINVVEFAPAQITTPLPKFQCANTAQPVTLAGTPPGGTFSGPGVSNGIFDPKGAGSGRHAIIYEGDSGNCRFRGVDTTILFGPSDARIGNLQKLYCTGNQRVFALNPTPPGGQLRGRGISGNLLDPAGFGVGLHRVSYFGSFEGCPYFVTEVIEVRVSVEPQFIDIPTNVCISAVNPIPLRARPGGGTFSSNGQGVIFDGQNYFFVPSLAGLGVHRITYTGDTSGCSYIGTIDIRVTPVKPARIEGLASRYCSSDPNTYPLRGFPTGGVFDADFGISGNTFRPFELNASFPVTYTVDSGGCFYTATQQVDVRPVLPEFRNLETVYCATDEPFTLQARPVGGTFFVNDIPTTIFDPRQGPGVYFVTYRGDSATCPYAVSRNVIVFAPPTTFLTDLDPAYCATNTASIPIVALPPGGTLQGPGISGNLFRPSEVGFLGPIVIEYFGNDGGCRYHLRDTVEILGTVPARIENLRNEYCATDLNSYTLVGHPPGGAFFGRGIIGDQFFPERVGVGHSQITYIGDSAGCQYVITRSTFVGLIEEPRFLGLKNEYCSTDPRPVLLRAQPPGGTFSGPGVVGDTLYLNRTGLTAGTLRLTYAGTSRGCNYSLTADLRITGECCPTPRLDTLFLDDPSDLRAKWYAVPQGRAYEFSVRRKGSTQWITQEVRGSEAFLPPLEPCTEYEYRVRTLCLEGFASEWTDTVPFRTQPVECLAPGFVDVLKTTTTTALLSWTPYDGCVQNYVVEYREADDENLPWTSVVVRDTVLLLTGLKRETAYTVRIRTRCADNVLTLPSQETQFETLPFDPPPCPEITNLELVRLTPDEAYLRWTPVGGAAYYEVQYKRAIDRVWISAQVFAADFRITNLQPDQTFEVRIRTYCIAGGRSEFVGILRFNSFPSCDPPTQIEALSSSSTRVNLRWLPARNATRYRVEWRPLGSGLAFSERLASSPSLTLTDLLPSTVYEVRIASDCGFDFTNPSEPVLVATLRPCSPPTIVRVEAFATAARVEWLPVAGAQRYEICWRPTAFGAECTTRTVEAGETLVDAIVNLRPNTDHVVRIRALCEEGFTPWVTRPFRTTAARQGEAEALTLADVRLYPNPTRGPLTVELTAAAASTIDLVLLDLTGRTVFREQLAANAGPNSWQLTLPPLAAGVYLLRISEYGTFKLVVE